MTTRLNPKTRTFVLVEVVLSLAMASQLQGAAVRAQGRGTTHVTPHRTPCFAFTLQGDVWIRCGPEKRQITQLGNVDYFAVSTSGTGLALYRASKIETFLISPGGIRRRRLPPPGPSDLVPSCGTVMLETSHVYDTAGPGRTRMWGKSHYVYISPAYQDAFTGLPITEPPYEEFRCSSDGKIVSGFLSQDPLQLVLEAGFPPRKVFETSNRLGKPGGINRFAISDKGTYVAYSTIVGQLCSQRIGKVNRCVSVSGSVGRISVSNEGNIIYGQEYWDGLGDGVCYYKDRWHSSLRPRRGYNHAGPCSAVLLWHAGLKKPQVLVPLGTDPQWITPGAASSLIELSKRLSGARR